MRVSEAGKDKWTKVSAMTSMLHSVLETQKTFIKLQSLTLCVSKCVSKIKISHLETFISILKSLIRVLISLKCVVCLISKGL